ncbi:sigma 54-interacting transcriptional regulator [Sedimentibacter sp.]|uniref:sigma-54 interaction domain-containing protein n=1 Tax=Sedimentibacter sp. TaxID=1960295 RepID=UPI0028A0D4A7|nr:sigma 54-interacting transcriptional regulator [Sedimentibacter sp.]
MDYKNILKLISENISSGLFIVNKEGIVIFYNQSANDLAGLNVENAIGKHMLEIFPKLTEETSTIIRALTTGEVIKNYVQNYYNYQRKLVTILSNTVPIYENGEIVGAIEIFSDVDQYKNINQNKYKKQKGNIIDKAHYTIDDIVGVGRFVKDIKSKIKKIADSKSPVLVYGETGTGKELIVQSIHNLSQRCDNPFIAQNCAAIPGTLLESMLFGTALGSFTGAKDSKGLIEAADGGTLFLDEINSMDIMLQAKLLRVLQEGQIRRVGENKTRFVDVRIITALNQNPYKAIEEGKLRSDLFYRLNVINFSLLPLRERSEDLEVLAYYFLNEFNRALNKNIKGFSNEVIEFFHSYNWPGNIRELRHSIEHAVNMIEKDVITIEDLPKYVDINYKAADDIQENIAEEKNTIIINEPLNEIMNEYERKIISKTLRQNDYNVSKTSERLNIPRQTLYYKMKKLGIKVDKILE